ASLILVSNASPVGGASPSILRADEFRILDLQASNPLKRKLIASTLQTPYFYFSFEADLTRPLLNEPSGDQGGPSYLYENSRKEYRRGAWDSMLGLFLTPLIHGAVLTFKTPINQKNLRLTIISRRSTQRVEHAVANHVETEQILRLEERPGNLLAESSFLQTRGSIPLYWHQTPDIPLGALQSPLCQADEALWGLSDLCEPRQSEEGEGRMEAAFAKTGLHYVPFDFHAECKKAKGGWAQLNKLIRLLQKDFEAYGYYFRETTLFGKEEELQKGVFRTNCMDCLDRTNVVQSLLATEHINSVWDSILNYPTFQRLYKNAWADHANLISVQYSGTGALKTDFTRTGVRTKWGLLQDGWNSANRYVFNNFCDGFRTDALNYFVGALPLSSIAAKRNQKDGFFLRSFPSLLKGFIAVFMLMLILLSPEDGKPLFVDIQAEWTCFVDYPTDYDPQATPPLQPGRKKASS
ncbi:Phosphatidylinositide phosphatase SAC1Blike, partial [Caligus rogercresseyi]